MISAASTPNPIDFASKKRVYKRLRSIFALSAILILGVFGSVSAGTSALESAQRIFKNFDITRNNSPVPNARFFAGDGTERTLKDYRGKGIVLNFWATWCAPCVREMPQLDRLSALVKGNGIDVLTVSEDRKGMQLAPKFYEKNNLRDLPVLIDDKSGLSRALSVQGLPTTVLIDENGVEIGRVLGIAEWDSPEIVNFVRTYMAPKG